MTTPAPPIAPVKPVEFVNHGDRRVDPYYWLRERENPEMLAYLEAENAYTALRWPIPTGCKRNSLPK